MKHFLAFLLLAVPITRPSQLKFTANGTGAVERSHANKFGDTVSVCDFIGDTCPSATAATNTAGIQAAFNTGKDVLCPTGTYTISDSLYMNNSGQTFSGSCVITMDASLGKPMLWLGASSSTGTDDGIGAVNMKVRGVRFLGTGSKVSGSSGITFLRATTTTLSSIYSWASYAGVDVRGISLANNIENSDFRQNNYGIWDKTDASTTINFQASTIKGNRIEQNIQEGIVSGAADLHIVENTIEGNSAQSLGGTGTESEIRFTPGFVNGTIDLSDNYFEILGGNTPTGIIKVDATVNKKISLKGGVFYGNDATNRCIINDASAGTVKGYSILGGAFNTFKNYICGAITNNSIAYIAPAFADASRDATSDLTATAGAIIWQFDRLLGLKTGAPFTSTVGSGSNAIAFGTNGARLKFGAGSTDYLYSDSANVKSDGTIVSAAFAVNGGNYGNNGSVSTNLRGGIADGAAAVATKLTNSAALSTSGAAIVCLYSDNASTKVACFDIKGGYVPTGVTFANLGTGTVQNGVMQYCTDCVATPTCAGSGSGAIAFRQNGSWTCNGGWSVGTSVGLTAQSADLAATNVYASAPVGTYRVCATARTTTSGTGTTANLNIIWTDEGGVKTDAVGTWALNSVTVTGQINKCEYIKAAAATNIQVSVTAGTYGTSQYALSATVDRLN